jgi:hypothetical protein
MNGITFIVLLMIRIAFHVDVDMHHKVAQLASDDIKKANPKLSDHSAQEVSNAIQFLMNMTLKALPIDSEEQGHIVKRDHDYQHPILKKLQYLKYDPIRNRVSTYLVKKLPVRSNQRILKRSFQLPILSSHVAKRGHEAFGNGSDDLHGLDSDSDRTLIAGDKKHRWSVWAVDSGKKIVAVFKNALSKVMHFIATRVEEILSLIQDLLERIGIPVTVSF